MSVFCAFALRRETYYIIFAPLESFVSNGVGVIETPTSFRLDYQAQKIVDRGADTSWGPEVTCGVDLPDSMNAVITGWGSSAAAGNIQSIGIQYRPLRANGTLGEARYRMCGADTDISSLEQAVMFVPEDRVVIATSYDGRYRDTLGIRVEQRL